MISLSTGGIGTTPRGRPIDLASLAVGVVSPLYNYPPGIWDQSAEQHQLFIAFGGHDFNMTTIRSLAVIAASLLVVQVISLTTAQGAFPVCDKSPEIGHCKEYSQRYYYNKEAGTCKTFIYSDCGGNENNFRTEENCENVCKPEVFSLSRQDCYLSPKIGPCKAYVTRYYYDKKKSTCKKFKYGGCKGNQNNFPTMQDCLINCMTVHGISSIWHHHRHEILSLDDEHMFS
ncbi:BPTI/Kunitz domain-containing protein-like [Rana temporaria]|uniref:BPTI/Kunitz domain-containing protein-like n=1 Tax=Rana temporaria TaxID=8407 RepID=UPI001AAD99E3|nr:BPTI/Kunitz domain-containing protein-like [Rana temporaria]